MALFAEGEAVEMDQVGKVGNECDVVLVEVEKADGREGFEIELCELVRF